MRLKYPKALHDPDSPLFKMPYKRHPNDPKYLLIVHHTAGHQTRSGMGFIKSFLKRGLCTDFLDQYGQVWQQSHGDRGGYHAGKSKWSGLSTVSRYGRGIEIAGGGKLKLKTPDGDIISWSKQGIPLGHKLVTYFNKPVLNARYVSKSEGYVHKGWYEPFTDAQETALADYLIWWCQHGLDPKRILGHDDVAPGRKNDPGGSLSMPLRSFVLEKVVPFV